MTDRLEERAFAHWDSRAYCEHDEHGERPGGHVYRSECVGCLAELLRSVAAEARREEAEEARRLRMVLAAILFDAPEMSITVSGRALMTVNGDDVIEEHESASDIDGHVLALRRRGAKR